MVSISGLSITNDCSLTGSDRKGVGVLNSYLQFPAPGDNSREYNNNNWVVGYKTCRVLPWSSVLRDVQQVTLPVHKLSCSKLRALWNGSHFSFCLACEEAWGKWCSVWVIISLGIYSIQVCLVWHYILFLSEDCTARWFCIFSGHFLLPCLLWRCSSAHFFISSAQLLSTAFPRTPVLSLDMQPLDFLCTLRIWMAPQILMTLRAVSPAQPWFRFKSIYWAPSMCQEVLGFPCWAGRGGPCPNGA